MKGQVEGIGTRPRLLAKDTKGETLVDETWPAAEVSDVPAALDKVIAFLRGADRRKAADGDRPSRRARRTRLQRADHRHDAVLDRLERFVPLAPLHQPNNLGPIRSDPGATTAPAAGCLLRYRFPQRPSARLPIALRSPKELYVEGVRRYGFHGLSYEYIARRLGEVAPEIADGRVVVAHLGSGASMCAISAGKSLDSTMGFTALDGLPMGTRPGQLDAGVVLYLMSEKGMSAKAIERFLYNDCGLKGLVGHQQRRERAARQLGPAREAGAGLLRLSDRALCGNARGRDGRHRRLRVHGGHRGERAGHSRGGDAAPRMARPRARPDRECQRRAADLAQGVARRLLRHSHRRGADDCAPHARVRCARTPHLG